MNCTEIQKQLVTLLYNEATTGQRECIEQHLAECASCREEWESLREGRQFLNRLSASRETPRIDVFALLRSAAVRTERGRRSWKRAALLLGTAAAVLVLLAASQVQVRVESTHAVIAWGEIPAERPAAVPFNDPWPAINRHDQRLAALDDLTNVAARELLRGDQRDAAKIVRIRRQLEELERQTSNELKRLQVQSDLRWRLIQHDLSQRSLQTVSLRSEEQ